MAEDEISVEPQPDNISAPGVQLETKTEEKKVKSSDKIKEDHERISSAVFDGINNILGSILKSKYGIDPKNLPSTETLKYGGAGVLDKYDPNGKLSIFGPEVILVLGVMGYGAQIYMMVNSQPRKDTIQETKQVGEINA